MNAVKYHDLILDAIDQLRHRKARPDAERIYNSLFRRHSISCSDAKVALEKCVEAGIVLRVSYKGNISYRNAAKKYSHLKRDSQGEIIRMPGKPRRKFTALLTNAFAELFIQEPDYLEHGVPLQDLVKTILSKDSVRYTKKYVNILLEKEVEAGGLIKMENGNFLVGPNHPNGREKIIDRCQDEQNELERILALGPMQLVTKPKLQKLQNVQIVPKPPMVIKQQPQPPLIIKRTKVPNLLSKQREKYMEALRNEERSRRRKNNSEMDNSPPETKRAKKVFDPSENHAPKKRGRPSSSLNKSRDKSMSKSDSDSRPDSRSSNNGRENSGVCSVCHNQNKKGPSERMISCRECSNKAHASCLNGDDMMLKMYPDNTWQCRHCKTCVVCYETSGAGTLIVCSICADGYHMGCHSPKIDEDAIDEEGKKKWLCTNCKMPQQLVVDHIQIGYNIEAAKITNANVSLPDESVSDAAELSRNTSPSNYSSPPSPTPPRLSPQTVINGQHPSPGTDFDTKSDGQSVKDIELDENIDPSIPDATNWSTEEVYQYFSRYFPDEAAVFKEQEIDGHSLLLMKRMDVLKGLELKLGPALKIYRHVLKLQYRRDDPKLYWV